MKTQLTKQLIKKMYRKRSGSFAPVLILLLLFAAAVLFFVPVPFGPVIVLALAIIVFGFYRKYKKLGGGNPSNAYLILQPVTEKKILSSSDGDGRIKYEDYLYFGPYGGLEVPYAVYEKTENGKLFYLACYSESGRAFACFDAEEYEPGPDMVLRA